MDEARTISAVRGHDGVQHEEELLSPQFMARLERLDILSRKILSGKMQGERRSKRRGRGVEFADYRPYVPGDDLRFIDWHLFARLERLFLRLFMEEEDLCVSVLLDVSASMAYGRPDKLLYAQRLAAALGYIGLVNHNRVHLAAFADGIVDQIAGLRGRRLTPRMLDFLRTQSPRGAGDLAGACKGFGLTQHTPGVVVVISDLLDKGDFAAALGYLAGPRFDVFIIQVLCPQELEPEKADITGDVRLTDAEDGATTDVSVTAALLKRYKADLAAHRDMLREQCARRAVTYTFTDTTAPFDALVLKHLRQRGLVG